MSMAKCKNTIISRSLNDNHHQTKRSPPIDHGHHHGHHHGHSHSHHAGGGGGTHSHHSHHGSSSSHGHHHGHHNNSSSSSTSGSTVAHAHQHNQHNTHHQQPPQIAHHHSFHSTSHHHHHPSSSHHQSAFTPPNSDPLPTSLYAKHVMSSSSSTINSNSSLVSSNDHHHSPHHHSSHHNSHHGGGGGGSHHNSHHSPNHHSSPHHSHHNFHHLHNNYPIYGDSSTPERDLLSSSSSSGATGAHLSISSRNLSHGANTGGHESSLSPNMGTISTTALELSTHNYHNEDHTTSPPSLRRSHWSEVTSLINESTSGGGGGKGLNMEGTSGNGGEGGTDGDGDGSDSGSTNLNPSTPQSIYDSSLSAIDNSSSSLMTSNMKKAKRQPQPIPDNCKDDAYWERRRRNNESAKRSRESRRQKEHQTHLKVKVLEHDNMRLLAKVSILENEVEKLRKMVYDRREGGTGVIINNDNDGRDSGEKSGDHKMLH